MAKNDKSGNWLPTWSVWQSLDGEVNVDREPAEADGSAERKAGSSGALADQAEVLNRRWGMGGEHARNLGSISTVETEGHSGPSRKAKHECGPRHDRFDRGPLSSGVLLLGHVAYPVIFCNGATRDGVRGLRLGPVRPFGRYGSLPPRRVTHRTTRQGRRSEPVFSGSLAVGGRLVRPCFSPSVRRSNRPVVTDRPKGLP